MKKSIRCASGVAALAVCATLAGCNLDNLFSKSEAPSTAAQDVKPTEVLATVNGNAITELDIANMVSGGLDKANALDRAINREIAATLGRRDFGAEVKAATAAAEREIAANVYASNRMKALLDGVTEADIKQRYDTLVKDADFNGYKLMFALFVSQEDARGAIEAYKAGKPEAIKAFQPVVAGKNGEAMFVSRNDVPYNLGVFVAKLKEGEFTTPVLVRNGYIVLQAKEIKTNPKPTLEAVKDSLRASIADEKLAKELSEARKAATVALK